MTDTTNSAVDSADSEIVWGGLTKLDSFTPEEGTLRQQLASYAKGYEWSNVLALISKNPRLINATRPEGHSLFAPLHQAAHAGASLSSVEKLIQLGAWRTLRNREGDRAVDIAIRRGFKDLEEILQPIYRILVPADILARIQRQFHGVILARARSLVEEHSLRLPELDVMLEHDRKKFWFAIPGMYGGFAYWLEGDGLNAKLTSESWCRIEGGSGQRHEITESTSELVEEGFV